MWNIKFVCGWFYAKQPFGLSGRSIDKRFKCGIGKLIHTNRRRPPNCNYLSKFAFIVEFLILKLFVHSSYSNQIRLFQMANVHELSKRYIMYTNTTTTTLVFVWNGNRIRTGFNYLFRSVKISHIKGNQKSIVHCPNNNVGSFATYITHTGQTQIQYNTILNSIRIHTFIFCLYKRDVATIKGNVYLFELSIRILHFVKWLCYSI